MSLSNHLQKINHEISMEEAIEMTTRYRAHMQSMLKPEFSSMCIMPICETFKKSIFEVLAMQSACVAIRSYLGMDANKLVRFLFVGVDDNNNDILAGANEEAGHIFEYGQRCPPICSVSPLNPEI